MVDEGCVNTDADRPLPQYVSLRPTTGHHEMDPVTVTGTSHRVNENFNALLWRKPTDRHNGRRVRAIEGPGLAWRARTKLRWHPA